MDAYVAERASRPPTPGRTRRRKISPSRAVIECLANELGQTTCMETNIYATATEEFSDRSPGLRDTKPFDYLLATLKPPLS